MLWVSTPSKPQTQLSLAGHPGQTAGWRKYLNWRGAGVGVSACWTFSHRQSRQNAASFKQAKKSVQRLAGKSRTGTLLGDKWLKGVFVFPT
jgi:hypothetical protein